MKYQVGSEIRQRFGPFWTREALIMAGPVAAHKVIKRNSFDPGDSVAMLTHDVGRKEIVLTRQWRYPAAIPGAPTTVWHHGHLLELPAGRNDPDDADCYVAAIRETQEEIGVTLKREELKMICDGYASPGGSSEVITIFYAPFQGQPTLPRGGVDGEDIDVLRFSHADFLELLLNGQIRDLKTILAGYWAIANGIIGD